jgi:glutamine amidotransferase
VPGIVLIDYGSGNLRSAEKALQRAAGGRAGEVVTTDDPDVVARAERLVLPGVGAFRACMEALSSRDGLVDAITEAAQRRGAPFLGICVGMQLLAARGLEFEATPGLNWMAGEVRRLERVDETIRIPHMGWNTLSGPMPAALFGGLGLQPHMYFTHSFALYPDRAGDVAAWSDHGGSFVAAVARDNLTGVQFHPEKSQAAGLAFLANFLAWRP